MKPTKAGIYLIISPSGGHYIGQSWDLDKRVRHYRNADCKCQRKLYYSIKKYGWNTHEFKVVHSLPNDISQNVMNDYETFYYNSYKELNFNMLNLREAGSRGKNSEETLEKMRKTHKENYRTGKRKGAEERKIIQFDLEGNFIREWNSQKEAAEYINIDRTCIHYVIKGKTSHAGGFLWKKKNHEAYIQ